MKLADITRDQALELAEIAIDDEIYSIDLLKSRKSGSIRIFVYLNECHLEDGFHDFEIAIAANGQIRCSRQIREIESLSDDEISDMARSRYEVLCDSRSVMDDDKLKARAEVLVNRQINKTKSEQLSCNYFKLMQYLIKIGVEE